MCIKNLFLKAHTMRRSSLIIKRKHFQINEGNQYARMKFSLNLFIHLLDFWILFGKFLEKSFPRMILSSFFFHQLVIFTVFPFLKFIVSQVHQNLGYPVRIPIAAWGFADNLSATRHFFFFFIIFSEMALTEEIYIPVSLPPHPLPASLDLYPII